MKRVLIFSLAYYPHIGGAEIALKEITNRIPDINFHMITLRMNGEALEEEVGNIIVHRVGNGVSYLQKILFIPRAARLAVRLNRENSFDMFWAMMSYMLFPVVLLRFCGVRIPYILTLQEGDPWEYMFNRWFILPFRHLLTIGFKNASAIHPISTYLAAWAHRMGYHGDVSVIPNGVEVSRFVCVQHQVSHTAVIKLVTTSRLVHKNAVDDVIRALVFLPDTIHFSIYGSGPEEEALKKLATHLNIADRVQFNGHVDHTELPRVLADSDIFIRPSRSEGMGNSFIEAMATGLPVVATQEGGITDFLFDAKRNPGELTTGWAVDRDSPKQIAEAVKEILENPEQVALVTANAKKLVAEKYEWNTIASSMRKLFNKVLVQQNATQYFT